jgi:hypothetical protein
MKKIIFTISFFFISSTFLFFSSNDTKAYSEPLCVLVDGKVTPLANGGFCVTQVDSMKITIKEVGLCTSIPSAPTTSKMFNDGLGGEGGNCRAVYKDPTGAGELVSITRGSIIDLNPNYIRDLVPGTYTYGYVVTKNTQSTSSIIQFTAEVFSSDGTTKGSFCGIRTGLIMNRIADFTAATICGTESVVRAASGVREQLFWNITEVGENNMADSDGIEEGEVFRNNLTFDNINGTGRSAIVYLTEPITGYLSTTSSTAIKEFSWAQQLAAPIVITGTEIIQIAFDTSGVATIEAYDGPSTAPGNSGSATILNLIGGGPHELLITTVPGELFE